MKRLVPLLAFVASAATAADVRPVLITGEVEALDSQTIFVPPSNASPIVVRSFLAEGTQVRKGDIVLRINSASTTNIDQLRTAGIGTHAKIHFQGPLSAAVVGIDHHRGDDEIVRRPLA